MKPHFDALQKQYPVFVYRSYSYEIKPEGLSMSFAFETHEHKFFPHLLLRGVTREQLERLSSTTLTNYIFHLGMVEIPSYWKLTCSPKIVVEAGYLSAMQIAFWQKLMEKGLGEFFYVNDIMPFAPEIEAQGSQVKPILGVPDKLNLVDSVLVPVGGGKDSIVTLELIKKTDKKPIFFTLGNDQASEDIISVFVNKYGETARIQVDRTLDPTLHELNARGYLNGHTPFSSILAFNAVFAAHLRGVPNIALSNEKSANEETGIYQGVNINHQYSKTFEFESDFRSYCNSFFPGAPAYFSLLRPLFEIQIMKIFSRYPEYFQIFRSCNIGKKTNSWCGSCAKCLFVSLLLSAFLKPEEVMGIFGKDLLADAALVPLLKQLTGDAPMKAFECVGTRAETMIALYLSWKKRKQETPLPAIIENYRGRLEVDKEKLEKQARQMLKSFDENHTIPQEFVKVVQDAI